MWKKLRLSCLKHHQSRSDARYWMLGAGALGQPRGMVWGGRREEGSGWGIHVYLWQIHFDIWQNQYNIVKLKKKNKLKTEKKNILNNTLVIMSLETTTTKKEKKKSGYES